MKVLIVDDEALARQRVEILLQQLGGYQVFSAENAQQALDNIAKNEPDLVILDIQMPGLSGLELAEKIQTIKQPPAIIFATAWDQYAINAFEVNAVAYLLKPFSKDQLHQALSKASRLNKIQLKAMIPSKNKTDTKCLVVTQGAIIEKIDLSDVYYFHSEDKYTVLYFTNGQRIIERSLRELEQEYSDSLLRIHRAYLVNKTRIMKVSKNKDGSHQLQLNGTDTKLMISRRMLKEVKATLNVK
jgi:two-component system, LytTR family, response regulator AlgR